MIKNILNIFFVLIGISVFSQNQNIKGNVVSVNDNLPIIGVTINVEGTDKGGVTDFEGNFLLKDVAKGQVLKFSSIGYKTKLITINSQTTITVVLNEDVEVLDGVVLVGYGTQKKKEITGAVSVLESDVIEKLNPVRVEQALQGQVSGVAITAASGSPGAGSNIRIRGVSTNGDNRPLILVDGNPITDLSAINPNDIKSVNVLKDASAGIYGVRAANGVIIIETKSGKKESPLKFNVDSYYAFQQTSKKIDVLNPTQFAEYYNNATGSDRFFIQQTTGNIFDTDFSLVDPVLTTDWQDKLFEVAPMFNVSLTASGGTKKLSYTVGGSYLTQDGIVGGASSNFTRYTARTKLIYDVTDKLNLTLNVLYTGSEKQNLQENGIGAVLYNGINADPLTGVFDDDDINPDGLFERYRNGYGVLNTNAIEVANPVAQISNTYDTTTRNRISPTFSAQYKMFDKLSIRSKLSYNREVVDNDTFLPLTFYGEGKSLTRTTQNQLTDNKDVWQDYTWNNILTYKDSFRENHNVEVLLGQELRELKGTFTGSTGVTMNEGGNDFGDAVISNFEEVNPRYNAAALLVGEDQSLERLSSLFTRVQYNYKEKYLFSGMFRRDTSSKFGPNNKVGYFPSMSLGWLISEESFMKDLDFISSLKLRASTGQIGNDRIDDFVFISRLDGEGVYATNDEETIEDLLTGVAEGQLSNPNIKWETSTTSNVGVDLYLLNNRINITADVYTKKTEDLLVNPDISGITGVAGIGSSNPFVNAGDVQNQGFEFLISYREQLSKDFSFNTSFNFTTIKNEVLFVASETGVIEGGDFGVGLGINTSRMEAGNEIGYFYGYKTDGIYQTQAEIDALNTNAPSGTYHTGAGVGDLVFVDVDGDGEITEDDRTDIGDPIPDLTLGFNIGFTYKNLDFSTSAFGSYGNELVRDYERVNTLANKSTRVLDAWTVDNPNNTTPRVSSGASINTDNFSDYYVEDASYLRIQNVQVGYTFPEKLLSKARIDKLRFYASVNNLHTFTNYSGYDPSGTSPGTDDKGEPIGAGIDKGFYPIAETYIFGMNLSF